MPASSSPHASDSLSDLSTVIIDVNMLRFRCVGGVFPSIATFAFAPGTPLVNQNNPDLAYFTLPSGLPDTSAQIDISNNSLTIWANNPVTFSFRLKDWNHIFLGVSWDSLNNSVGRETFPEVNIVQSLSTDEPVVPISTLTVKDVPDGNGNPNMLFRYLLLVQNAASGEIGLIDPSIKNKPN